MSFLPGMFPSIFADNSLSDPASIALFGLATSPAPAIAAPANIEAGDLIVIWNGANGIDSIPATVIPTGFTSIVNVNDGTHRRAILSYKRAVGTEGSTNITCMGGSLSQISCMFVFRRTNPASSVSINDVDSQYTSGSPSAQTVTSSGGVVPLVVLGCYYSDNPINPRTFTPDADGEISKANSIYLKYKIYNSSPSDISINMNDDGDTNILASCYIELTA